mgnify:CR=1 FL=1
MSENEKNYISRQISVYKTDKKLVEFIDKLKPAPAEYYAHIHSFGDKDESGVKQISCIGITLQNYTNGTGKNIKQIFHRMKRSIFSISCKMLCRSLISSKKRYLVHRMKMDAVM